MKRALTLSFYFLLFACHLQAQPYRLRVDSLKVDHKFYIGSTDRFGFFSFLNSSNQLQGSTGLVAGSVYNDRLLAPYINFSAGDGLYGSGGQIYLGNTILFQVNVDNSSLEITNDTLNVKAGGITGSHILNGTIQNEDITNPNILFSAGDGLYGSGGQVDLGGSILLQVNVDDTTIKVINDTLHSMTDTSAVQSIVNNMDLFPVVDVNENNVIIDSSGLKVNFNETYFSSIYPTALPLRWHSKNGGVTRPSMGFEQGIVNDTIYTAMPKCAAYGYFTARGASGGETLYLFNKAGVSQSFVLTASNVVYEFSLIHFAANDSIYFRTSGTIYLDDLAIYFKKELSLQDLPRSIIQDNVAMDTTDLDTTDWGTDIVYLDKFSSGNEAGGGILIRNPGYASDGVTVFGDWMRLERIKKMALMLPMGGAKGDNSNDDTEEIQAVLNAAMGTSGQVLVPLGTYRISETITIPYGVDLIGMRGSATNDADMVRFVWTGAAGDTMLKVTATDINHQKIRNIHFLGGGTANHAIWYNGGVDMGDDFDDCAFNGFASHAIVLKGGITNFHTRRNRFDAIKGYAVYINCNQSAGDFSIKEFTYDNTSTKGLGLLWLDGTNSTGGIIHGEISDAKVEYGSDPVPNMSGFVKLGMDSTSFPQLYQYRIRLKNLWFACTSTTDSVSVVELTYKSNYVMLDFENVLAPWPNMKIVKNSLKVPEKQYGYFAKYVFAPYVSSSNFSWTEFETRVVINNLQVGNRTNAVLDSMNVEDNRLNFYVSGNEYSSYLKGGNVSGAMTSANNSLTITADSTFTKLGAFSTTLLNNVTFSANQLVVTTSTYPGLYQATAHISFIAEDSSNWQWKIYTGGGEGSQDSLFIQEVYNDGSNTTNVSLSGVWEKTTGATGWSLWAANLSGTGDAIIKFATIILRRMD